MAIKDEISEYEALRKELVIYVNAKDYEKIQEVGKKMLSSGFYEEGLDAYKTAGINPQKTELIDCAKIMLDKNCNKIRISKAIEILKENSSSKEVINELLAHGYLEDAKTEADKLFGNYSIIKEAKEDVLNSCAQKLIIKDWNRSLGDLIKITGKRKFKITIGKYEITYPIN